MEGRMRRQLRLMSLVAVTALLGAGCLTVGLEDTTDVGASEGTIRYVLWDSNQLPAYQKCAQAFQSKNPKIQSRSSRRDGTTTGAA
jgi:multiple sugar transport system substrate-binding protein